MAPPDVLDTVSRYKN